MPRGALNWDSAPSRGPLFVSPVMSGWLPPPTPNSNKRRKVPYVTNDRAYDAKQGFQDLLRELKAAEEGSRFAAHAFEPAQVAHEGLVSTAAELGWSLDSADGPAAFRKDCLGAVFSLVNHGRSYAGRSPVEYVLTELYVHHGALAFKTGRNGDGGPRMSVCGGGFGPLPSGTEVGAGETVYDEFCKHRFSFTHDYSDKLAPLVLAAYKAFVAEFVT